MKEEAVWKVGLSAKRIYKAMKSMLRMMHASPQVYLDEEYLAKLKVRKEDWDLAGTDDFFACMTRNEFEIRRPTDPIEPIELYEDVEYPNNNPPIHDFQFKDCGYAIIRFFDILQARRISEDGRGILITATPPSWGPFTKYTFENLYKGDPMPSSVQYRVESVFFLLQQRGQAPPCLLCAARR